VMQVILLADPERAHLACQEPCIAAVVCAINLAEHPIRRKQVLSGLTHEYYVTALSPRRCYGKRGSQTGSYFRVPQVSDQLLACF
jgi:hypothetical protein